MPRRKTAFGGEMEKKYYSAIDIVKIICAVLIVFIHTSPLESVNGTLNSLLVNYISRIAVPFFFISSGFLLFGKTDIKKPDGNAVKKYLKRILSLYLIWSAVYFPFTALQIHWSKTPAQGLEIFLNWAKNMIFSAGFGFLWYLPATIVAVAIVYFLLKRGVSLNTVLFIGIILYCIGLCGQSYFGLVSQIPFSDGFKNAVKAFYDFTVTTRNGVFEGVIFIAHGAKLSQRENYGNVKRAAAEFIVSMILFGGEFFFVSKMKWQLDYDMYLFLVPAAYCLLKLTLCINSKIGMKKIKFLRPYSPLIYFTHMIPTEIIHIVLRGRKMSSPLLFSIVFITTIAISTAIVFASRTKKLAFLKKIY